MTGFEPAISALTGPHVSRYTTSPFRLANFHPLNSFNYTCESISVKKFVVFPYFISSHWYTGPLWCFAFFASSAKYIPV